MNIKTSDRNLADVYVPGFFRLNNSEDRQKLEDLLEATPSILVFDEMESHLRELIKSLNPSIKIKAEDYPALIEKHLNGRDIQEYGVWIYYPWNNKLVHILDEEEFVEVRTNRNRYKITREEQNRLKAKKIGIVGLSVGQSIALTLAMERTCGELRLADFDIAELSNLNRIRTGIQNLALKKTIIAAREIAEIDPFLKVKIFSDGLHKDNIDEFFTGGGKIDILVEVCDGLDVKILSRFKARSLHIPVVMDTNDRGMMDVERFDLHPEMPILHGLAGDLDPDKIGDLTNEQKIPYILKMVGADTISTRLKASMMEVEQSINTWPQLASSVVLGGALTTDVCRRILLDQYHDSGRYYIDIDELIADKKEGEKNEVPHTGKNPYKPLERTDMEGMIGKYFQVEKEPGYQPTQEQTNKIIDAAIAAPSAGNNQPWKWYYSRGVLFLFHDKIRSWSWGDYFEMGAHIALGTALENAHLQATALNLEDEVSIFPLKGEPRLIAAIKLKQAAQPASKEALLLAGNIFARHTNRKLGPRQPLPIDFYKGIEYIVNDIEGVQLFHTENERDLDELGDIISACDRIRMLNQQGHEEFYSEVRWNREHAEKTRDGIELAAVDLTQSDIAGFSVAKDWEALALLDKWDKGNGLKRLSVKTLKSASSMLLFSVPGFDHEHLINAGRAVEKAWILANKEHISVHPMLSPVFFFNRLVHGKGVEIPDKYIAELNNLREKFLKIFPLHVAGKRDLTEVFLMKLSIADEINVNSLRRPKDEIFYRD